MLELNPEKKNSFIFLSNPDSFRILTTAIYDLFQGLIGPASQWPLSNIVGLTLGVGLLIIGVFPSLCYLNNSTNNSGYATIFPGNEPL